MTPTLENYYHAETQREYITNSQIGVYEECQFRWFMQYRALEYEPVQDQTHFLLGHLFECLLLRPNEAEQFYRENREIFLKPTVAQCLEAFEEADSFAKEGIRSKYPELFASRGPNKGEIKKTIKITDDMRAEFPAIFDPPGAMKKEFEIVHEMVESVDRQGNLREYMSGEQQVILTDEWDGVPVMGMVDLLNITMGRIVDIKTTKDMDALEWDDKLKCKVPFYERWNYWRQLAVYRDLAKLPKTCNLHNIVTDKPKANPTQQRRYAKSRRFDFNDQDRLSEELMMAKGMVAAMSRTDRDNAIRCGDCECCRLHDHDAEPIEAIDYRYDG